MGSHCLEQVTLVATEKSLVNDSLGKDERLLTLPFDEFGKQVG